MEKDRSGDPVGDKNDVFAALAHRRVYIETYGCSYNFGDTANLVEVLKHYGSIRASSPDDADAVIINTCTVVGPTERRMLRRLLVFADKPLFVTGCMPLVQREAIFSVCSPVIISPDAIREAYLRVRTVTPCGTGIVQIAKGCLGRCTYCITRRARGPLRSFPGQEIREKIQSFVGAGAYEIQLTAQDTSVYGRDTGTNLPALLSSLIDIPGNYRIRVGMMNPATVLPVIDDLVDAYKSDHIFRFVHLPVQSGSDRILEKMGRGYSVDEFLWIVSAFRRKYPDISIATDFIVGFPGETEEDFSRSLELVWQTKPSKVNVTRYSHRPFTGPFAEKDFPDSVKKDRSRILNAFAEEQYSTINQLLLGTTVSCVVTEKLRPGSVMARTATYMGVVIRRDLPIGASVEAVLKKDRKYFFIGDPVV
ncbi:MAG TPA: MiaB/RimO family radical SAM methylthiotransferase [Methanoregula sp.]|nr:MiaB/RimO family radical SAM methylthiotransferase [Methanoregula sp.]